MKRLLLAITLLASVFASAAAAVPQTEDVVAFAASDGGTGMPVIPVASDYHFSGTAAATLTIRVSGTGATSPVLAFRNSGNNQPGYVILSPNGGLVSGIPDTSAGFTGSGYLTSGDGGVQFVMANGGSFGVETWARIESIDGFDFIWSNLNDGTAGTLHGQVAFLRYFTFAPRSFTPGTHLSLPAPQMQPVAPPSVFSDWIDAFTTLSTSDKTATADPDRDGVPNFVEFALKGDPANPAAKGLSAIVTPDLTGTTGREMTLTLAVRAGAVFSGTPAPAVTIDGVRYSIEGSLNLATFDASVIEAPIPLASTATSLPDLSGSGWESHTFIL